jgi:hypothetical protein
MNRANSVQRAVRLNQARDLLRRFADRPALALRLAQECSISPRQAYRYLQQAQRLKQPVPLGEVKVAFTVKLPPTLMGAVKRYAAAQQQRISDVVERALRAQLPRRIGRV